MSCFYDFSNPTYKSYSGPLSTHINPNTFAHPILHRSHSHVKRRDKYQYCIAESLNCTQVDFQRMLNYSTCYNCFSFQRMTTLMNSFFSLYISCILSYRRQTFLSNYLSNIFYKHSNLLLSEKNIIESLIKRYVN